VYAKYARQDSVGGGGGGGGGAPKKINSKEKPKWGVGPKKKEYKPASQRYVNGRQWKEKRELNMRRREEQLLQQQVANERNYYQRNGGVAAAQGKVSKRAAAGANTGRSKWKGSDGNSSGGGGGRISPPIPTHRRQQLMNESIDFDKRPMSVTTLEAKYSPNKHSRNSPVPDTTNDFVEYRRSEVILNPNEPSSRPHTSTSQHQQQQQQHHQQQQHQQQHHHHHRRHAAADGDFAHSDRSNVAGQKTVTNDPLINADMVKQRDRQDRILKEISVLRHGLLLKQREVASYPVAMATITGNKSERQQHD